MEYLLIMVNFLEFFFIKAWFFFPKTVGYSTSFSIKFQLSGLLVQFLKIFQVLDWVVFLVNGVPIVKAYWTLWAYNKIIWKNNIWENKIIPVLTV